VSLFGTHDTWAGRPDMRFHERPQVERLVDGLDIVVLDETEEDGPSFLGPKALARVRRDRPQAD
jgi:hypothetical protein